MPKYTTVLIDTVSIQNYVFGSNRLKENVGASFLIKEIYNHPLVKELPLKEPQGYIGGGNAFIFFADEPKARNFIKVWSTHLMVEYPGVKTAVAIGEVEFDNETDNRFENGKNLLFDQLAANKFLYHPQVILPSHGFTASCTRSGLSMEEWIDVAEDSGYFSSQSKARNDATQKATEKPYQDFPCIKANGFEFTNELEELGSSKEKDSHIAIVHIDGNGMGKRFRECNTLKSTRDLSITLEAATKCSFENLLNHIIDRYEQIKEGITIKEQNPKVIPIRPIILGGDDVTFVCDGRLGLYFAKIFLEEFQSKKASDEKSLSACAGVAITKLKYPFYRGYMLAEELCRNAKKKRKKENDNGSWVDWHISYGGFSGPLEDIRKQYLVPQGNLLMRPYKVINNDSTISFSNLINNAKHFFRIENGKPIFPNSKIKELREILYRDEGATKMFKSELVTRKLELPKFDKKIISDELFIDGKTPFFDMIELMEVYPKFELQQEVENAAV